MPALLHPPSTRHNTRLMGEKLITNNRKLRHDYEVLDTMEAGIALQGTEVKSLRTKGSMTLKDSFADITAKGEVFLVGAHIAPYDQGNINNHEPERKRKLLLHKEEIEKVGQKIAEKGLTLAPLKVYFKRGKVKIQLALCRGKKHHDKRDAIKARESKREMDRAIKNMGRD